MERLPQVTGATDSPDVLANTTAAFWAAHSVPLPEP
jgi:hypothetical protein